MASGWIQRRTRYEIYSRDGFICCYCGKTCVNSNGDSKSMQMNRHDFATLDHIKSRHEIALSCQDDSSYAQEIKNPRNLVTVCNGCNSSKKHTPLAVWCEKKGLDYNAIVAEIKRRIA